MQEKTPSNDFITDIKIPVPVDYSLQLEAAKINFSEEIEPPKVCWEIVNEDQENAIIGTLGNFSAIIGKAKSKKSFFISLGVSATTKNGVVLNRFKGTLNATSNDVLYFDTEQSRYHVHKASKRICQMIEIDEPDNLHVYGLRKFSPSDRLAMIEDAIYKNDRVGFVVIDGIRDLVTSINDEEQATYVTSKLLKWTEERNIHIVTVLHQNKGDNNARGHLGSELVNKAETVLSVTKSPDNNNISIVNAEQCRDIEPEPFAFEIIEGIPHFVEGWVSTSTNKKKKYNPSDLPPGTIDEIILKAYIGENELGYGELVRQMKLVHNRLISDQIGDNKTKELITHCKSMKWLVQETPKGKYKIGNYRLSVSV